MIATPLLGSYKRVENSQSKNIFRLARDDLTLFFDKRNVRMPDNEGECRIALNIIRDCGYTDGLCQLLNTDKETGIIGD